tara:strand:+ start:278 stop:538 length:261 start_codon:yes stop_codon:yes gene_type:complete
MDTPDYMITLMNISIFMEHLIKSPATEDEQLNATALSLALKQQLLDNLEKAGLEIDIQEYIKLEKEYRKKQENWDEIEKFYKDRMR